MRGSETRTAERMIVCRSEMSSLRPGDTRSNAMLLSTGFTALANPPQKRPMYNGLTPRHPRSNSWPHCASFPCSNARACNLSIAPTSCSTNVIHDVLYRSSCCATLLMRLIRRTRKPASVHKAIAITAVCQSNAPRGALVSSMSDVAKHLM
jgi:hypothetical protein